MAHCRGFNPFNSAVASALAHRGALRGSQLGAFGRTTPPKPDKKPDALLPLQADLNTTSLLSPVNSGAASLLSIFAILLTMSQTQLELGKTLQEQGKMLQEQGKMLQEQGKVLTQVDSKFSQVQSDVSTLSSVIATVSTSVVATTYLTQKLLGKPDKG